MLYQDDELSKALFSELSIPFNEARRNGTVSGTALELFLSLDAPKVYFAGLDMQSFKGQNHASPNSLEIQDAQNDYRLKTQESRAAPKSFENEALKIYSEWFKTKELKENFAFRISAKEPFKNSLGSIKDISADDFLTDTNSRANAKPREKQGFFAKKTLVEQDKNERLFAVKRAFDKWILTDKSIAELFPADAIIVSREKDSEKRQKRLSLIAQKAALLREEIF